MSWKMLFRLEANAIFSNKALMLTVFGGVVFYSFLYPMPYSQQLPRNQAVVVVDLDGSSISRKLQRMADASPDVEISRYAQSIREARAMIVEDGLAGMLVIPEHFYRDLLLGKSPTLSYAGDASYFLVYGTVVKGLARAGGTLAAEIKVLREAREGLPLTVAKEQHRNIRMNLRPVFNTTTGYVNYVVPAVFVLILHQTLLIGVGLLGGTQNEMVCAGKSGYWLRVPAWQLIFVRSMLFLLIYLLLMAYYFGFSFAYYDITRLAQPLDLLRLALPFILATGFLGICIGHVVPRRELATLLVLLSSLPLVFSAGFVWPVSMLPKPLYAASQLVPAIPGIQAFLQLNQMGADFDQLRSLWLQMWLLAVVYGGLAWLLSFRRSRRFQENLQARGVLTVP